MRTLSFELPELLIPPAHRLVEALFTPKLIEFPVFGRLRRIEGQIRGLQRMVDEDTYCIDVLTQISAAKSALQAVAVGLLEDHLAHCVVDAARAGDPTAKVKEASDAIARLVRS